MEAFHQEPRKELQVRGKQVSRSAIIALGHEDEARMTKLYDEKSFEAEVVRIAQQVFSPVVEKRINHIIEGREYDAIFIGDFMVHAIESTVSASVDKAKHDLEKLSFITTYLEKEFRGSKAIRGWFVSKNPLTYHQQEILRRYSSRIQHLSYQELLSRLIDTQRYLRSRENHPFGSVQDPKTGSGGRAPTTGG